MFILLFMHKMRQSRHLTKKFVKECKVNKPTRPFLSINKVVLLLLIALELPLIISSILYLFNNRQDNFLLLDLIVRKVSLYTYIINYKATNWLRSISFYP